MHDRLLNSSQRPSQGCERYNKHNYIHLAKTHLRLARFFFKSKPDGEVYDCLNHMNMNIAQIKWHSAEKRCGKTNQRYCVSRRKLCKLKLVVSPAVDQTLNQKKQKKELLKNASKSDYKHF